MTDINELLLRAAKEYAAMPPVDKALLYCAQRRSFAVKLSGPEPEPDHMEILAREVKRLRALLP